MSGRILELMKQVGIDVERLRMYPGGFPREDLIILEDFAKLVIQETLQVSRAGLEFGNSMEDAVEQYFGIKL